MPRQKVVDGQDIAVTAVEPSALILLALHPAGRCTIAEVLAFVTLSLFEGLLGPGAGADEHPAIDARANPATDIRNHVPGSHLEASRRARMKSSP